MDEIRERFEEYAHELRTTKRTGSLAGTDSESSLEQMEELIEEYRSRIRAEESPARGRELLARFREEAERL